MRRLGLIVGSALLMVLLVGPGVAYANHVPFEGSWVAVDDIDGSDMTLEITRVGRHSYRLVFVDLGASVCGWEGQGEGFEATLTGTGGGGGNVMTGAYRSLVCADGTTIFGIPFQLTFDPGVDPLDPGDDTLTEFFGQVWHRA